MTMNLRICLGMLAFIGLGFTSALAQAEKTVSVNLMVIEATREAGSIDGPIKAAQLAGKLQQMGFKSAKLIDALPSRSVALGASVTLEIRAEAGRPKKSLKVTLRDVTADGTVKLRVAIPESKFESDTVHKNGGAFMVALGKTPKVTTFLVVIPKV